MKTITVLLALILIIIFREVHRDAKKIQGFEVQVETLRAELAKVHEVNAGVAKALSRPAWYRFERGVVTSEPSGHGEKLTFEETLTTSPYKPGPASYNTKLTLVPKSKTSAEHEDTIFDRRWRWKELKD